MGAVLDTRLDGLRCKVPLRLKKRPNSLMPVLQQTEDQVSNLGCKKMKTSFLA